MLFKRTLLLAGLLVTGMVTSTYAGDTTVDQRFEAMQAKLSAVEASNQQLRNEVAQLRSATETNWLNERRAEEVKALIKEVLNDADTRASLLEGGMAAGYNGKHFFLASEDGSFLMNFSGMLQFRYIWHHQDGASPSHDDDDTGFQFRRIKLGFDGHIADPKLTYKIVLATTYKEDGYTDAGRVYVEDAVIGYDFGNGLGVNFGKFKIPFLHQELVSSSKQLAADRGLVTEYFTLNRAEQVELNYKADKFKLAVSLNDGANSEQTDIGADSVDYALAARAQLLLAGQWNQFDDTTAWSGEETGLMLGAAIFFSEGDSFNSGPTPGSADYTAWTVDASFETNGLGLFLAYMGADINPDSGTGVSPWGLLVEGGYQIIPDKLEPFVRWEYLDHDSVSYNELQAITIGLNWYLKKHAAKFTTDVVWVYDGDFGSNAFGASPNSSGLGFTHDNTGSADTEDIIVWRAQFQLLF